MSTERGWFADIDDPPPDGFPWTPCLQVSGAVHAFDVHFKTREECEQFIREEILGAGMLDTP